MAGTVGILNVGAGDTKLIFDNSDPDEVVKSAKIVEDMIRRGFVLLIEVGRDEKGPTYRRARGFDASTAEYIVAGTADQEEQNEQKPAGKTRKSARGKAPSLRIRAASTSAVAVARTAGG